MPEPAAKVSVSPLEPAVMSFCPDTAIVLKALLEETVEAMVVPEMEMPEPAVRLTVPVWPWSDKTPELETVGVCPRETLIPDPARMP